MFRSVIARRRRHLPNSLATSFALADFKPVKMANALQSALINILLTGNGK